MYFVFICLYDIIYTVIMNENRTNITDNVIFSKTNAKVNLETQNTKDMLN